MEYGHGGDIYTYPGMLDFSANINPLGPSEAVLEAAKRGVERCAAYPDPRCRALRAALSEKLGVPAGNLMAGNGAAELFFTLTAAEKPKRALIPVPAFSEYEQALSAAGSRIRCYPLEAEEAFRLPDRFCEALTEDLDMVFLCSPSNPAGQTIPEGLLRKIIRRCGERRIRLVLDESFIGFADPGSTFSGVGETGRAPWLFVVGSFTKLYALPGLRLGYGVTSDRDLLERMSRVRQPWSVSGPAQEAGIAALSEAEETRAEETRRLIAAERGRMEEELRELGIRVIPSEANFLLLYAECDLAGLLRERKILIRDCGNYRGLGKGWYRTAVRLPEENRRLLDAVRAVLRERKENM